MKVLVLDDHRGFREEVVAMLVRNGHEADEADSAEAAVPLAQSGQYDFILVDYAMPEHDGLWFMENVKLPRRTKAILVTGHVNRRLIDRMFAVGISIRTTPSGHPTGWVRSTASSRSDVRSLRADLRHPRGSRGIGWLEERGIRGQDGRGG